MVIVRLDARECQVQAVAAVHTSRRKHDEHDANPAHNDHACGHEPFAVDLVGESHRVDQGGGGHHVGMV